MPFKEKPGVPTVRLVRLTVGDQTLLMAVDSSLIPALLLKPPQAAEALAISPRRLWAMTASGEIPVVRIGNGRRVAEYRYHDAEGNHVARKSYNSEPGSPYGLHGFPEP
jgi:hypothetical protein